METFSIIDDDGIIVVARSGDPALKEISYPGTVLDAMKAGTAVAFETGGEDTWTVRVHATPPTGKKKELRGPFRLSVERGQMVVPCSYGDWTRGEAAGGVKLSPGDYEVVVRGHDEEGGYSFDVFVTPAKAGKPKVPKTIPSFASKNPYDLDPQGAMAIGVAMQIMRKESPDRDRAEQWARIALRNYRKLGGRGAPAVKLVLERMAEHGLTDGPITV